MVYVWSELGTVAIIVCLSNDIMVITCCRQYSSNTRSNSSTSSSYQLDYGNSTETRPPSFEVNHSSVWSILG